MNARFSLGIDLSNSAIAFSDPRVLIRPIIIPVAQIVGQNQLGEPDPRIRPLSPPPPTRFPRRIGAAMGAIPPTSPSLASSPATTATVPDRLVASAKSWLSNPPYRPPKEGPLPWQSDNIHGGQALPLRMLPALPAPPETGIPLPPEQPAAGWDLADGRAASTVPASFDGSPKLTTEAANAAGLEDITLLEEPQAAFYAWTAQTGNAWQDVSRPETSCSSATSAAEPRLLRHRRSTDSDGELTRARRPSAITSCSAATTWTWCSPTRSSRLAAEAERPRRTLELDLWQCISPHARRRARPKITLLEDATADRARQIAVPARGSQPRRPD